MEKDNEMNYKAGLRGVGVKWNENDLKKAMEAIRCGASVLNASHQFNIPRRTLRTRLGNEYWHKGSGRPQTLGVQHQVELEKRVTSLLEIGISPNSPNLKHCVASFCVANRLKEDNINVAVQHWLRNFLTLQDAGSSTKLNGLANPVKTYFDKLAQVMLEQDLFTHPERIYCLEEKSCPLTLQHPIQILNKGIDAAPPEMAEKVSIAFSASAIGHVIPPVVFFKGKKVKQDWLDNAPVRSEMIACPTAVISGKMFAYWLDYFVKFKIAGNVLLIFDSVTFPVDYGMILFARKRGITLLCLPDISCEDLHPMHRGVYQSFENHWDAEVLQLWSRNPALPVVEQNFGLVFKEAWEKSMMLSSVTAGFRLTGIFPYDKDIVPVFPVFSPKTNHQMSSSDSSSSSSSSTTSSSEYSHPRSPSRVPEVHSNEMFRERFTAEFIASQQLPRKKKQKRKRRAP